MKNILDAVSNLLEEKDTVIISVDGPCASGKTTLSQRISEHFDCNVIHMDDFFLRPEQKNAQRLAEIGGNLDRERFMEQVLMPLSRGETFSYRPYLCSLGCLGEEIFIPRKKLYVVEGSYSQHPYFGDVYDLRIFLEISPEKQRERLCARNPERLERFLSEWIPKEKAYFDTYRIKDHADLCEEL